MAVNGRVTFEKDFGRGASSHQDSHVRGSLLTCILPRPRRNDVRRCRARAPFSVAALLAPLAAALLVTAASVPANAASVSVTDDRGEPVTLDFAPARIVSLLPSLTETVCALGACEALVGTDRFSNWPEAVAALPKLGGFEDVQVERLFALRPDLVLAAESNRVIERLESLGLNVVAIEPRSLADARRAVSLVGELLGRSGEAEALLADIDERVHRAAARVPPAWYGAKVYFEVSSTPHAAGESSFIGELLAALGLGNIVPAALGPFPALNPEFVVRASPEAMLGSRRAIEEQGDRPGWESLSALEEGHVCGFEERRHDVLVRPGPRLGEAAEILADCFAALPPRESRSSRGVPPQ